MEKGGRGIGTIRPTNHFLNEIWESGDIRNSELMIIRDFQVDNPEAKDFKNGSWLMGYMISLIRNSKLVSSIRLL